jgi:hypothetical protein
MLRERIKSGITHVGLALRDPELFTVRWDTGEVLYTLCVGGALLMTAVVGTTTYGMTMGLLGDTRDVLRKGMEFTLAAGIAWAIPLPALYMLNSLSGSRLPAGITLLTALVTVSWGGLALIASIPINWFFTVSIPHSGFILLVNLVVFTGVGISMADVFRRVMHKLEPDRNVTPMWWLALVGAIGIELFFFFKLFVF